MWPHDYKMRLEETEQGMALVKALTPYDGFLIKTYGQCYSQFSLDAGIVGDLLPQCGSWPQQRDMVTNLNKIHAAMGKVNEARAAYKKSLCN